MASVSAHRRRMKRIAEWIRNGHECSACGFRLPHSAKCYEWVEQEADHGYKFKSYAVIPAECPKCHDKMTAVVWEEGDKDG